MCLMLHSIIPDKDVRERVPVLVHGPKRLVDHTTIVVSLPSCCLSGRYQHAHAMLAAQSRRCLGLGLGHACVSALP